MSSNSVCNLEIIDGTAARYIRRAWIGINGDVQASAFNLRELNPPESYASFCITFGKSETEHVDYAKRDIRSRMRGKLKGFVALMDIAVCLEDVNDDESDIIQFREERLPHCGLYYLTNDNQKILEAKTTLAYLATERLHSM